MTKTADVIVEILRNPKHAFRKTDDRPAKAQRNPYERRKLKEYLNRGHWQEPRCEPDKGPIPGSRT
jgi:hypothetical protein